MNFNFFNNNFHEWLKDTNEFKLSYYIVLGEPIKALFNTVLREATCFFNIEFVDILLNFFSLQGLKQNLFALPFFNIWFIKHNA